MPTGEFWDLTNPLKPVGEPFDPNSKIDFPISIADWMTEMGSPYASHILTADTPLEVLDQGTHVAGVITPRIGLLTGATFEEGTKYPFLMRVITANGQQDDQRFWLKIKSK